jgi:hypothetical protein
MIDFCVVINGINLDVLVPLFFTSFFARVNTTDLNIHVILKDVPQNVKDYIQSLKGASAVPFHIYEIGMLSEEVNPNREEVVWMAGDAALTCQWIMKNCGTAEWVVISHFDIMMRADLISVFRQEMTHDMGMLGQHCHGMVAIRRVAYNQCFVGFQSITNFFAVRQPSGIYKLLQGGDERCTDTSIRIEGFDVGELLELNMRARYWRVIPFTFGFYTEYLYHIGAGSGYHGSQEIGADQRQRGIRLLQSQGKDAL